MTTPILATKLYSPPPRPNVVRRARLIDRLNEGQRLTLICAPAGFGKTTLLSDWLAGAERPAAWLSLDEGDSDLPRFLSYLVAALRTIAPTIGADVVAALQAPQPPPTEALLTALANDIAASPDALLLVLDDYHALRSKPVDDALAWLVDHLPPQMRLIVATREDPPLPLARLRARGQLIELRAADLRFTASEAAEFLNEIMDLRLTAADIDALEERTEGWIAGLQLAALSLRGRHDVPGFIRAFAGDHRYIVDYLVEEVLQRQPNPIRAFLLQTAILERLNGSLCDAVTGQEGGQARLEALERGNFFLVPLDDQRYWYRYHHLFADVLSAHVTAEQPEHLSTLHRRASEWYERNGAPADAIRHALAANDFARAAGLVELAVPTMRQSRQEAAALRWFRALPDELFHNRPVLSVHYAGALLLNGEIAGVEARLRDAERWLDAKQGEDESPDAAPAEPVVVDQPEFRSLAGSIALYRAACALAVGDVANTMKHARQVLALAPEDDHIRRGPAAGLLGLALWTVGDLEAAYQSYAECMARLQKAGHISDVFGCCIALADIRIAQGRLREAMSTYEQGLQLATEQGAPTLRGAADLHVGMSELHRERGDLPAAMQHLLRSKELGEFNGLPQNRYRWLVAMARVREAEGDLDGALDLLHEAERRYVSDFFPNVRPIAALKARVWIAQRRLAEALNWAREQGLSAEDDLNYLREFEHITLARVLLARSASDRDSGAMRDAMRLLERLLSAADEGGRTGHVIEILVVQALAHQTQGDSSAALASLERALTLAEPEGYLRTFTDEEAPMLALLEKAAKQGITPTYTRRLLQALGKIEYRPSVNQALIEPLSERELEVLRLLGADLNGPAIARELTISLNTLRTHTKNIFSKLGVNNRQAAVRRAHELHLL